jgi:usherin
LNTSALLYIFLLIFLTDNWDYRTVEDIRSVYNNTVSNVWVLVTPVIPMSSYKLQVNASNTAGYIVSNIAQVDMPEGSK